MKVTREMKIARPIIDVAVALSKVPHLVALEGIKLYLSGGIEDIFMFMNWESSTMKPERGEFIYLDDRYWYPTQPYGLNKMTDNTRIDKLCPVCKSNYFVYPVAASCKKANPKGWHSRFECSNDNCLHEEYSTEYVLEITSKYKVL